MVGVAFVCAERRPPSGRLEAQADRADGDDVAVGEAAVAEQALAVDEGAVGRAEVAEHEAAARAADLGVVAARVAVGDDDPAVGEAADEVAVRR